MLTDKRAAPDAASARLHLTGHSEHLDTDSGDSDDNGTANTPHRAGLAFILPDHGAHAASAASGADEAAAAHFDHAPLTFPAFPAFPAPPFLEGEFGGIQLGALPGLDHQGAGGFDAGSCPAPIATASGSMDGMSWSYNAVSGLQLDVAAGHLVNGPGNGGFTLDVLPTGAWELKFGGSDLKIGYGFQAGWMDHGPSAALNQPPVGPLASNVDVSLTTPQTYDGSAGDQNIFGDPGRDIFIGGPNDYMNGGGGLNCAAYTGPDAVLIDLQHGHGYGGNAAGNSYVNMEQGRGSAEGSVLIGNSDGSDLKSGGADSILISTGGTGPNAVGVTDELRPDGPNCLLVSTVGEDNVVFDPTHGWQLGDAETMVGFNAAHGDDINLTAAVQNWVAGQSNIADYVKLVDESDGTHVFFSPDGQVATAGAELIDLKLDHGLNLQQLYANHNIVI